MNIPVEIFLQVISTVGSLVWIYVVLDRRVTRLEERLNASQEQHKILMNEIQGMRSDIKAMGVDISEIKIDLENKEDK